jgi:hypothetical protein
MKIPFTDNTSRWRQSLLQLSRTVTIETRRRCMCIPSRDDAKEEERCLRTEFGSAIVAVKSPGTVKDQTPPTLARTRSAKPKPRSFSDPHFSASRDTPSRRGKRLSLVRRQQTIRPALACL